MKIKEERSDILGMFLNFKLHKDTMSNAKSPDCY